MQNFDTSYSKSYLSSLIENFQGKRPSSLVKLTITKDEITKQIGKENSCYLLPSK